MGITHVCDACGVTVEGADLESLGDAHIAHVRAEHPDWPYPDRAIRNYVEAAQCRTGSTNPPSTS
jgi:hypothetical protein